MFELKQSYTFGKEVVENSSNFKNSKNTGTKFNTKATCEHLDKK